MKILVVGSSGLIGSALVPYLQAQGFTVGRLLRHKQAQHPYWLVKDNEFQLQQFSDVDVVINLAGANIAEGRWTEKRKQQLVDSRIETTKKLVEKFKDHPPKLFINASAIGFYGERGNSVMDEDSDPGEDFVSQLAQQWESSCAPIQSPQTRLVKLRTGIVLSARGGALAKMLPPFKFGLGGKVGSGEQIMSWIDIDDFCRALLFIIQQPTLKGPINMVAPNAINNLTFSQSLAKQLGRPCIFPLPSMVVKLLFAQMGKELLLASTHVAPKVLLEARFEFKYGVIQESLAQQLS